MADAALLELRQASVIFNGAAAVDRVSLSVRRGEFVVLRGATGSGKSTVLKLLAGLVKSTSGEVVVAGDRVDSFSEMERRWLRRSMGLMMQDGRLLEDRTVHENVMLPALAARNPTRRRAAEPFSRLKNAASANLLPPCPGGFPPGKSSLRFSPGPSSIARWSFLLTSP